MCGRFTSTQDAAAIAERFDVAVPAGYRPRFNLAPAQQTLAIVVAAATGARDARPMRWGLVPHWAKDLSTSYTMINARAETLLERPAYRKLVASTRCLVPADGFYEWRPGGDGKKEAFRFVVEGEELFAFAGLWTSWIDRGSGEIVESCTIVTTAPNAVVAPFHDRMPAILDPESESAWLDASLAPGDALSLLVPYPADAMRATPASSRVGNVRNDDAWLLVSDRLPV